ncbi:MAG: 6,7-dimethyl-8-ribityllumazine synthase [Bacteroidales bacterium]|nr:6,7-dimethyl-8-ribityllumazine synthase [Bacteroidales bacterium]
MSEKKKNLSECENIPYIQAKGLHVAVVTAEWNPDITFSMEKACILTLQQYGIASDCIINQRVAGSFELPFAAKQLILQKNVDAVICLGCIIQGETRHFDFIAQAVSTGIMNVGLECNVPVIFGVLTTNNMQQAIERSGGKHGNKGVEAAVACLKLLAI